jgi:hypothetical protein
LVKLCAIQSGAPEDFEPGFGELIRRALTDLLQFGFSRH